MLSNDHTVLAVYTIHTIPITQPVPKTGRSRPPRMCTTSSLLTPYLPGCALLSPHSRLAENGVDLGWDGVGLVWDGVWDGMEWDLVE